MKYLLDTNIVSQYTKPQPDPSVDAWLARTDDVDLYICEFTFAELWYGICKLAPGRKRTDLENWVNDGLYRQFFNQVLFFNLATARRYGEIVARAEENGFRAGAIDAMMAAIAVENGMGVATLNRKDFERLGVSLAEF